MAEHDAPTGEGRAGGLVDFVDYHQLPPLTVEAALALDLALVPDFAAVYAAARQDAWGRVRELATDADGRLRPVGLDELRRLRDGWSARTTEIGAHHEQRRRRVDNVGRALWHLLMLKRPSSSPASEARWWPNRCVVLLLTPEHGGDGYDPDAPAFVEEATADRVAITWAHDRRQLFEMDAWQDSVRLALDLVESGLKLPELSPVGAAPESKPESPRSTTTAAPPTVRPQSRKGQVWAPLDEFLVAADDLHPLSVSDALDTFIATVRTAPDAMKHLVSCDRDGPECFPATKYREMVNAARKRLARG